MTSYLSANKAENLQNGDIHLAQIPHFGMGYLDKIIDLNVPNGSRNIPSQSEEYEQDGRRYFVGFQPHIHVNMTSQTQSGKIMKK